MEIRQLEIFCAVIERRGFSAAAEVLKIAQPTVSFQIASLEEELGIKLLDRSGRATSFTKSGEILYRYAVQILELTSEARQAIDQLSGLLWGEIAIGASTIPGEYILPEILQRFRAAHPGIAVEMIIGDTRTIIKGVQEGQQEIGIVGATVRNEKLTFSRFVSDKLVLIAPAGNDWFQGNSIIPEELIGVPFILREEGSGTRTVMEQQLGGSGISPGSFNLVMTLGSTEAVKRAVESGAGVSIVSSRAVQNEIKLGLLEIVDITGIELVRDFFVVHRRNKVLSPAVEALKQFLIQ
ncbi:MAG: selenium metabolism-associated LysR family transcriptional regulator [Dehalococcoidia bacterium]